MKYELHKCTELHKKLKNFFQDPPTDNLVYLLYDKNLMTYKQDVGKELMEKAENILKGENISSDDYIQAYIYFYKASKMGNPEAYYNRFKLLDTDYLPKIKINLNDVCFDDFINEHKKKELLTQSANLLYGEAIYNIAINETMELRQWLMSKGGKVAWVAEENRYNNKSNYIFFLIKVAADRGCNDARLANVASDKTNEIILFKNEKEFKRIMKHLISSWL